MYSKPARSAASATLSNISRPAAIFQGLAIVVRITARWNEPAKLEISHDHRTCFEAIVAQYCVSARQACRVG